MLSVSGEQSQLGEVEEALGRTYVIIPMLNEQDSIGLVLGDLPAVADVIVVDNGSTDDGPKVASQAGAVLIAEPQRGYGKACLTGIDEAARRIEQSNQSESAIIVFLDGDYSDHPEEIVEVIRPIVEDRADLVIGSRATGNREQGAMHFQALFGNWLACTLMRLFWGARFTDLGPFRAIRYSALRQLGMKDENYGWTIEMQIRAVQSGLRCCEVPVSYRVRVGVSKISGTVMGTFKAGYKILYTIFRYRLFG
ncbi:MAG: glycosyltransferase family 2 protein [Planctomycetota bacterium]